MAFDIDAWLKRDKMKKIRPGGIMAGPRDYLFEGATEFPETPTRTDTATGVQHMQADPRDITELIRGTTRSWMHPEGMEYRDPMAAAFGGPDYLPYKELPGGGTRLQETRMKGALTMREEAGKFLRESGLMKELEGLRKKRKKEGKVTEGVATPAEKAAKEEEFFLDYTEEPGETPLEGLLGMRKTPYEGSDIIRGGVTGLMDLLQYLREEDEEDLTP